MEQFPQALEHPLAAQDEETLSWKAPQAHPGPPSHLAFADVPDDLGELASRRLRLLCNRAYQLLDTDYPFFETQDLYNALVEELERREHLAERPDGLHDARETFRDNVLFSRFELYRNGVMAGYVQYELRGGDVLLLHSVVDPKYRRLGLESVLMQAVLFNAHRRRLAVMPFCVEAQDFLTSHPHFLSLIPVKQRRRLGLLGTTRAVAAQEPA